MKTLIMSSSFRGFTFDENGNKIPCQIDNENGFLDTLKLISISGSTSPL